MSVHIHTLRNCCARALVLLPVPLLLCWALAPGSTNYELAQVSGRVTCANLPFSGVIYFLPDHESGPMGMGPVNPDGSFQLYFNGQRHRQGVAPGTYRVFFRTRAPNRTGSRLQSRYQNPRTTDLLVDVGPDWNYVRFNLD